MRATLAFCLALAALPAPAHAQMLEAVVAARTIARGEVLGRDALMLVPVRSLPGPAYVAAMAEARGRVAARTIVRGRLVPHAALRPVDHVAKGAALRLLYRAGALTIAVPATALDAGRIGGTVAVRVPETGLRALARIVDAETAEVLR